MYDDIQYGIKKNIVDFVMGNATHMSFEDIDEQIQISKDRKNNANKLMYSTYKSEYEDWVMVRQFKVEYDL